MLAFLTIETASSTNLAVKKPLSLRRLLHLWHLGNVHVRQKLGPKFLLHSPGNGQTGQNWTKLDKTGTK